jgi:hypothetical protein
MVQIQPTATNTSAVAKSHQRQLVDGSDPASEAKRKIAFPKATPVIMALYANEQVGSEQSTNCRWWDFEGSLSTSSF